MLATPVNISVSFVLQGEQFLCIKPAFIVTLSYAMSNQTFSGAYQVMAVLHRVAFPIGIPWFDVKKLYSCGICGTGCLRLSKRLLGIRYFV